jgi:hypothetical protein
VGGAMRGEVLAAVGQIPEAWSRAALLGSLVARCAPDQMAPYVRAVLGPEAVAILTGSHLAAQGLPDAVAEILESARRTGDCWTGALTLTALARVAGDGERATILHEASRAALSLDDPCCRAQALARLAPHLPPEGQRDAAAEVLRAVHACPAGRGARILGRALAAVAPFLQPDQVTAAWAEAQRLLGGAAHAEIAVPPAWSRRPEEDALAALARRLGEAAVRAELAAAGTKAELHLRAQTLSALAIRLAELGHGQEALCATRPIEPLPYQVDALLRVAPHLSLPWLREALIIARDLGRHAAPAAARLIARLAEVGDGEEAWRTAAEIPGDRWQAEALVGMAPHLPAARREAAYARALDVACGIQDPGERLQVLARILAPGTSLPHAAVRLAALREALGAAVALKEAALASPCRAAHRPDATPLAPLAAPLAALAAGPADPDADAALRQIWLAGGQGERLLDLLGCQPRPVALLEIAVLAPLLARLAGPGSLDQILGAIQQTVRWWP